MEDHRPSSEDNPEVDVARDADDPRATVRSRPVVTPPPGGLGGLPAPVPDVGIFPPPPTHRVDVDAAFTPPAPSGRPAPPPADEDLEAMVRRLLEQTAALPVLGDQIGTSLETFGDRLVDGLNEIFGNRLATMLDEFQRSVRTELTESRARLDVLQQRVETGSKAASAVADAIATVRERIETFEMPSGSDVAGELDAVARSTTDLVDDVQAVRRTVEKLDRAGVIRRKRLDQLRAQVDAAAEVTTSGSEQIASELVAQREAMDELNTWLGAVHTEVEVVRDKLVAAEEREAERDAEKPEWASRETLTPEALEPPPAAIPPDVSTWMSGIHDELGVVLSAIEAVAERAAEPPPDTDARLTEELARLSAEFQLLRRRLPVRAKPITAAIEEAQVKWIADTVVRSILEAVQLVPEDEDDDEWDIGEEDEAE
jgi:hypothetical protein